MNRTFRIACLPALVLAALTLVGCGDSTATDAPRSSAKKDEPSSPYLTRLIFQDHKARSLRWADVKLDGSDKLSLGTVAEVSGFKKLDPAKQRLVQMGESNGLVLVGVRDDADGSIESGWVLVHGGVGYVDHGDHGHWTYKNRPEVWDSRLDKRQGNPAHLYVYDGRFFLANDKLNGYTRLDPSKYKKDRAGKLSVDQPRFLAGGGNHITLAVVDDRVGYSCWIDGDGPNKGRVDVTPIADAPRAEPAYSFALPSGGIHGAIASSGKVFFAPRDGICSVDADLPARLKPDQVKVRHIALGKDGDVPRRTGAFAAHGRYVLFVTGKGTDSTLVLLDARQDEPRPISVALNVRKGNQARTPTVAATPAGKAYAFVFHDHPKDVDVEDALEIIDLDPNGDGDCKDAKSVKTLAVGRSAVEGHFGHHDVAFDADHRYAFFTNPGDGTLSALSLKTLTVVATFDVGGTPTALVTRGGLETDD